MCSAPTWYLWISKYVYKNILRGNVISKEGDGLGSAWDVFLWFMNFKFFFYHGQISKFWNKKITLDNMDQLSTFVWSEEKKWIVIKVWTWIVHGKIFEYFPHPKKGFSLEFSLEKKCIANASWINFWKVGKMMKNRRS